MKDLKINAAIQLLPITKLDNMIMLIDKAIAIIKTSNLKYKVCPFETVVEGTYTEIFSLVDLIRTSTLSLGCEELIINMKIHASNVNLCFEDKTEKYS